MGEQGIQARTSRTTFYTLDLLRGFAAVAVMLYHKATLPLSSTSAYLAVDLFLLLSGVVVAEAYSQRLASGWTLRQFVLTRLVRLWPLYAIGTCIGIVGLAVSVVDGTGLPAWAEGHVASAIVLAFLFLPGIHLWDGPLFPLNAAAWSLFAELVVNAAFAVGIKARLSQFLTATIALAAAVLAFEVYRRTGEREALNVGAFQFTAGLARACFSFPLGVLIHRCWRRGLIPKCRLPAPLFVVAFFAMVLAAPPTGDGSTWWAFAIVGLGFPILVAAAATTTPGPMIVRWSLISGRLSYPIYTVHLPAFAVLEALCGGVQQTPMVAYYAVSAGIIAASLPLEHYLDEPIRRRLSQWLGVSPRAVAAAEPL